MQSSNFIVLVMEAIYLNDDFKQKRDHWFNLIRNYDSNLERTMVVFTKCEIEEWDNMIYNYLGKEVPHVAYVMSYM